MKIRIAGRVVDSIVDGPGMRYALFTQGCPRACPGCHNPQTHDPKGGFETTTEEILKEIDSNPLLDGVTFSGGDPFMQPKPLVELAKELKKRNLNVITYTGYRWEELVDANDPDWNALIQASDVIVDGPFVQSLHDWKLKYTGSSNQRIIDVKRTLAQGELALMADLGHMPSKAE
ncbi:MAG: anaerobic ribonucleoside-triphosphate reductase activating protein [Thermoguttaceae bacterium]|nr:anaerobic ribonucleoside-triphosphate reductase activating protein [Thermoguttaceae bacterium]MBQ2555188.1 anaerobic ribonucleoside-triphosphate reductase activating protein [Thermoguttaceae bacterium]